MSRKCCIGVLVLAAALVAGVTLAQPPERPQAKRPEKLAPPKRVREHREAREREGRHSREEKAVKQKQKSRSGKEPSGQDARKTERHAQPGKGLPDRFASLAVQRLEHVPAEHLARVLNMLCGHDIVVVPDEWSNSLVIRAPKPMQITSLRTIIEQLDVPPDENPGGRGQAASAFQLEHAAARNVVEVLGGLFSGKEPVRFAADIRSNTVWVVGERSMVEFVGKLVREMDERVAIVEEEEAEEAWEFPQIEGRSPSFEAGRDKRPCVEGRAGEPPRPRLRERLRKQDHEWGHRERETRERRHEREQRREHGRNARDPW